MTPQDVATEKTFRLEITFTGLALYQWEPDRKTVAVIMPDARRPEAASTAVLHPDNAEAVHHVGYLRFDLKNLATGATGVATAAARGGPSFEIVHRFNRERLDLDLPATEVEIAGELHLPDFGDFAPVLEPKPGLLTNAPPSEVLMRTELVGGEFISAPDNVDWKIEGKLRPDGQTITKSYGGDVFWSRELPGDGVTLRLIAFTPGTETIEIPLIATWEEDHDMPSIRLKIANLCDNPMEWQEIETPRRPGPDNDFRWHYRLMQLQGTFSAQEFPPELCPIPTPDLTGGPLKEGDLTECFGVQRTRKE
jgi:hypothetical protein